MFNLFKKFTGRSLSRLCAGMSLGLASLTVHAATNTFGFNNTVLSANIGPNDPANGPVSISGASLNAGDVIVFDGIIINSNPGANDAAWGAVDLNGSGTGGVTGATLGVLVRDGTQAGNFCQMWTNGVGIGNLGNVGTPTNRCRIELTCTQSGSTTNMSYVVEIDQGLTGTFNVVVSGTGLNFPSNTVPLAFGTRNQTQIFIQNQPIISVGAPSPATNTIAVGGTTTFSVNLTAGWPQNTTQQWLSNGVPIAGATGFSYTTPTTTASYNGARYSVIVSNQLNSANVVTSSVAILNVRSTPGVVTFNFPTTTVNAGGGAVTDPGISINGSQLLAGDTVVFDGIVIPNGAQASDAWTAISIAGSGYGNVTTAKLGVLVRQGSGANPSQLFINGSGSSNPTAGSAPTNRVRIELYPSVNGSTTNMGWLVKIDQNLSGTFQPAITGTNLTFVNNTLPLTFGSSGSSSFVIQNPQSPVSIFSGPNPPFQVVAVGSPITVGVTVEGWSPAFQWRKNGAAILNATNETYTLPSATIGDNGDQFTVVVSNRLNSLNVITSSVANVSVLIPNNLSWYPVSDYTTWDTATPNWTTNGGVSQAKFTSGNNVTFDSLGYNLGGSSVTITNTVNPNGVTVNVIQGEVYTWSGSGNVSGNNLFVTGDGSGALGLQAATSFSTATVDTGSTLDIGYAGTDDPSFGANLLTNNGTIDFQNAAGVLPVSGVITGSGSIIKDGTGTTVLSATNSAYTIQAINSGVLSIASTPNPGSILNNAELDPASAARVLVIPNDISGGGFYNFSGFQTTILTGTSSHTGQNLVFWSDVIVDNSQALGDPNYGSTVVAGADRFGGLYLSNNIVWSQPLELDTRYSAGVSATAPHISNWSGTNDITSPLTFGTGSAAGQNGTEINVEATAGQLTIDTASTLANNAGFVSAINLNLQGAATGIWNGNLADSGIPLNVVMRGAGTWTLGGLDTYSGTTTVSNGTLLVNGQIGAGNVMVQSAAMLGGTGIITGPVTVAAGGKIAPGPGIATLTINNDLTLSAGSFTSLTVNKSAATNSQIAGLNTLVYGGTLQITNLSGTLTTNDSFQLFGAASYAGAFSAISPASPGAGLGWNTNTLTTDGTLRITTASSLAINPTNITAVVVGGNTLQLTWPSDHTGWTLEVQTNSLTTGLGTNWTRIASSVATNQVSVPLVKTNGSVFYRLVYP